MHVDNGMPVSLGISISLVKFSVYCIEFGVQKYPTSTFMGLFFGLLNRVNYTMKSMNKECIVGRVQLHEESRATLACLYRTSGRFYMLQLISDDSRHFTQAELSLRWSDLHAIKTYQY